MATPAHDDVGRTVASALLACCMAHRLDEDARWLRRLAMAALLRYVRRKRVAGSGPTGAARFNAPLARLADHQLSELPRATAVITTALGKLSDEGRWRSVVIFEALFRSLAPGSGLSAIIPSSRRTNRHPAEPDRPGG